MFFWKIYFYLNCLFFLWMLLSVDRIGVLANGSSNYIQVIAQLNHVFVLLVITIGLGQYIWNKYLLQQKFWLFGFLYLMIGSLTVNIISFTALPANTPSWSVQVTIFFYLFHLAAYYVFYKKAFFKFNYNK